MTSTSTRRPLLLGHRGARRYAPENTLAAFDLALAHGCDGFEFDLRRTADGRALVCHDAKVSGVEIAHHSWSKIGQRLPSLPALEDVLGRFAETAFLNLELKVAGLEDCVTVALKERQPQRGYLVSSFLPEVVRAVRRRAASVPLGFICDKAKELWRWRELPVDCVIPHHSLVSRELVEEVHALGHKLFVWTVNDTRQMRRLAEWGVDAIISDDSQLLARTLS